MSEYWKVKEGQLKENEHCYYGAKVRRKAIEFNLAGDEIRQLETREHHLPKTDPDYKVEDATDGKRFCLVFQEDAIQGEH